PGIAARGFPEPAHRESDSDGCGHSGHATDPLQRVHAADRWAVLVTSALTIPTHVEDFKSSRGDCRVRRAARTPRRMGSDLDFREMETIRHLSPIRENRDLTPIHASASARWPR